MRAHRTPICLALVLGLFWVPDRDRDHSSFAESDEERPECTAACQRSINEFAWLAFADDKKPGSKKDKPLKLPDWWDPKNPLPIVKSNCMKCHLTAGRELTVPLRDFARSVHDRAQLSCFSCHGGNTKEDAKAHEPEFGFIGTKLSAHIKNCAECHDSQASSWRLGKHYWDLSKGVNRKLPTCVDCHGNHDVGKPPVDFSLTNVCTDCHKTFAKDYPSTAEVVAENDRTWLTLRKVHARNKDAPDPTPKEFRRDLDGLRKQTARLMHRAKPVSADDAKKVNTHAIKLRDDLEEWLKKGGNKE